MCHMPIRLHSTTTVRECYLGVFKKSDAMPTVDKENWQIMS